MFATLLGTFPPDPETADPDDAVRAVVTELAAAGLEPVSDGQVRRPVSELVAIGPSQVVAEWRVAAAATDRAVKQSLPGPFSIGRRAAGRAAGRAARKAAVSGAAEQLRESIIALGAAGCLLVEIEEPDAIEIGDDETELRRFGDAHRRLTDGLDGSIHLSLVVTGGNADQVGAATFFDLPYASYAFDLIAGPDNWRLIAAAPGDRGIVCGALDPRADGGDPPEALVWAAHYAASTGGRGLARVGLANASGLGALSPERAGAKVRALAKAAAIAATEGPDAFAMQLDPQAVDIRSAAHGRFAPDPGSRRPRV